MKAGNSPRPAVGCKAGVTLVEVTIALAIIGIIAGVMYRIIDRQTSQMGSDDASSRYYMDLGSFAETLNSDLSMARVVHPESGGVSLLVNPDGNPGSITYSLKGNTIERKFRESVRVFEFTNPKPRPGSLIFRIEEVNP